MSHLLVTFCIFGMVGFLKLILVFFSGFLCKVKVGVGIVMLEIFIELNLTFLFIKVFSFCCVEEARNFWQHNN